MAAVPNGKTVIGVPDCLPRGPRSFRQLFMACFDELRQLHDGFAGDGLLIAAIAGRDRLDGYLHLPLAAEPVFAVAGRHENCDLLLPRDAAVSLRHLVIQLGRADDDVRVRVWDLASEAGFQLEDGQTVQAIVAEGAVFLRVGEYHLFMLPTGAANPIPWSGDAGETWDSIPERVCLDTRLPRAARAREHARGAPDFSAGAEPTAGKNVTRITRAPVPLRCKPHRLRANHERVGMIDLWAPGTGAEFEVGDSDLERGILIGRYERCQLGSDADCMSRIHLFVVADGDDVWAIDTASTNGTRHLGSYIGAIRMPDRALLTLADFLRLRWTRAS